jgi:hypothetical protein
MREQCFHVRQIDRLVARGKSAEARGQIRTVIAVGNVISDLAEQCARECGDTSPYRDPESRMKRSHSSYSVGLPERLAAIARVLRRRA